MQITSIQAKNFLTFGSSPEAYGMRMSIDPTLNILVGPNNSGKTNLFRAISFVSDIIKRRYHGNILSHARPYFHNGNSEEPIEVSIGIKLDDNEVEALSNFLLISSLLSISQQNKDPERDLKFRVVIEISKRIFVQLFSDVTLIARIRDRHDYPLHTMFRIRGENGEELFLHDDGKITNSLVNPTSYSPKPIIDLIYEDFRNSKHCPNPISEENVQTISFDNYEPTDIFQLMLSEITSQPSTVIDIGGFNFSDNITRIQTSFGIESFAEYRSLRNFLQKRGIKDKNGASILDIISTIYDGSIVRISNTRCMPSSILLTKEILEGTNTSGIGEIGGEELLAFLFKLRNSTDYEDRDNLTRLVKEFRKVFQGDFDVIFRTRTTKSTHEEISEGSPYEISGINRVVSHSDFRPLGIRTREIEKEELELALYFIKDNLVIPIELAAAGMFETLYLLTILIGQKQKVILLDEPALNLHPDLQRRILALINAYTIAKNNNQVLLVTHSPYLVDVESPRNIWRFSLEQDARTTKVTSLANILNNLEQNDREQVIRNLRSSDIRSLLFSRGVIFVEGPSEKTVIQLTDRYLSLKGNGAEIEDREWTIIDIGGKKSLRTFIALAKVLDMPYAAIVDYDALMKVEGTVLLDTKRVRTSSIFTALCNIKSLNEEELNLLQRVEEKILPVGNKETEYWYNNEIAEDLRNIALKYNILVLARDLEGTLQSPVTKKESKPIRALHVINEKLQNNNIPEELFSMIEFIRRVMNNRNERVMI